MQCVVDGLPVEVVRKEIKNIHLAVLPPDGRVRVSAPERVPSDVLMAFVRTRLSWVRMRQAAFQGQEREPPRRFVNRETHMVWGERRYLRIMHTDGAATVFLRGRTLVAHVRPLATREQLTNLVEGWYRREVEREGKRLIESWADRLQVRPNKLYVRRMKTRWGSCNFTTRNIRLNTQLGTKPLACLEYVVVHELCHLVEPTHNERFEALLTGAYPAWRQLRRQLNDLPLQATS